MDHERDVMDELYRKDETYKIIGAAMDVHNELGHELKEHVYQEALALELGWRGIPWEREREVVIYYKNTPLNVIYRLDCVVFGDIVVEIKALPNLTSREDGQLLNYLKVTRIPLGLLLNFGNAHRLEWKRMINLPTDHADEEHG
jgi:GxxExxY protein